MSEGMQDVVAPIEPIPCEFGRQNVDATDVETKCDLPPNIETDTSVPYMTWTVSLYIAMFGIGLALAMLGPTLEDLKNHFAIDIETAGAFFTFRAIGYAVGALTSGVLLERTPSKAAVFFAPLASSCFGALVIPRTKSYAFAGVLFAFQGLSMGVLDVGGNVIMLAMWRGSKFLNGVLHGYHFVFGFGALMGPLLVNLYRGLGHEGSNAWTGTGISLTPCCLGFLVLCLLPQPKIIKEQEGAASPWNWTVLLSAVFLFMYVGSEVTYGGFISIFLERYAIIRNTSAAAVASLYWGMLSLGRLAATAVSSYVDHTRYLVIHLLAAVAAMSVMGGMSVDSTRIGINTPGWWIGVVTPTAIVGFAFAPLFPGAMLVAEELLGGAMSGRSASLIVTAAASGEAFFPVMTSVAIPMDPVLFIWIMLSLSSAMLIIFAINASSLLVKRNGDNHKHHAEHATDDSSVNCEHRQVNV